jgi:invasion protein IalB
MKSTEKYTVRLLAIGLLLTIAGSVWAQQPPLPPASGQHNAPQRPPAEPQRTVQNQPAVQGDTPQSTTATYDDWVVQCQTQAGPPAQKICDMAQVAQVQVQGRSNPFSRVAIVHPVKGQPVKLIVQVPVNVSFATNVHIQTSDSDPGYVAPFARCMPAGCFAEFDLKDDVLKKLMAASGAGKLSFADAGGHDVNVPLSFKGFSQAYEALAKE